MRALVAQSIDRSDPLSGLAFTEVPEPEPRDGWAVVDVRAASLNHHDLWTLRGVGVREDGLPVVLGTDGAGVTADGSEVILHAVLSDPGPSGDETLAPDLHMLSEQGVPGTMAERVAVPARNLVPKPAELSWAEAACLPTAYLTAYRMLFTRGGGRPGERVLVQGAGGGVATAALVLARAAGMRVYVTSRSEAKRERVAALGGIPVESGARVPERVDLVIETVGEATWDHSLRALRPGGRIVVSGATSGGAPPAELSRVFWRGLSVVGSTMGTLGELTALVAMLATTGVRPVIDGVYDMDDAPAAFARLASGEAFGKVVLTHEGA
jgi:NADPH:quinone reductase-like Zn-dependent oxidoreductase